MDASTSTDTPAEQISKLDLNKPENAAPKPSKSKKDDKFILKAPKVTF